LSCVEFGLVVETVVVGEIFGVGAGVAVIGSTACETSEGAEAINGDFGILVSEDTASISAEPEPRVGDEAK
jgi:hypothetical protein